MVQRARNLSAPALTGAAAALTLIGVIAGSPATVGFFSAARMGVVDAPVVDAPPTDAWGLWQTDHGGYGTVLRFLPASWGGPGPNTTLLGAHQTGVFMRLPMLIPGDRVILTLDGDAGTYIVREARVVPWQDAALFTWEGLVMVTCTTADPDAVWAVFAERVELTALPSRTRPQRR